MRTVKVLMVITLLLIFASGANAQIPRTISYQGVLCDASGNPRPDNTYSITFRLYQAASGGTSIWTEAKSLQVTRGTFYTLLGSSIPFGAAVKFDKPYWLSIQVGTDAELSPRVALASMPYAFNALNADTAHFVTNEAGISTNQYYGGIVVPTTSTYVDLVSTTITTPSSGVLMIFADGYWNTNALTSGNGYLRFGIEAAGVQPPAYESQVYVRQNMQLNDAEGFSHHIVKTVSTSGTYQYTLTAYSTNNVTFTVWYPRLTIVFYPTTY